MLPFFLRYPIRSVPAESPDTSSLLTQNNDGEQEAGVGGGVRWAVGGGWIREEKKDQSP